jgi:hypothetical protein
MDESLKKSIQDRLDALESNKVDNFSDAIDRTIRSGIGEYQNTGDLKKSFKAIRGSLANSSKEIPSYKNILEKYGIAGAPLSQQPIMRELYRKKDEPIEAFDFRPEEGGIFDVSPSGIAGFGAEIVTDPLTYVAGLPVKSIGAGVKKVNPRGQTVTDVKNVLNESELQKQAVLNEQKLKELEESLKLQKLSKVKKEAEAEIPGIQQIIQKRGPKEYGVPEESFFENLKKLINLNKK